MNKPSDSETPEPRASDAIPDLEKATIADNSTADQIADVDLNASTMDETSSANPASGTVVDLNSGTVNDAEPAASTLVDRASTTGKTKTDLSASTIDSPTIDAPVTEVRRRTSQLVRSSTTESQQTTQKPVAQPSSPNIQASGDLNAATIADTPESPASPTAGPKVDLNAATIANAPQSGTPPEMNVDLNAATIAGNAPASATGVDLNRATIPAPTVISPPTSSTTGSANLDAPTIDDDVKQHWAATITEDVQESMTIKGERKKSPTSVSPSKSTHITVNTRSVVDTTKSGVHDKITVKSRQVLDTSGEVNLSSGADYELVDQLGEGGMGIVYKARQTSIDRLIAMKMIKKKAASDQAARMKFLSEAAVTGDLDHPNIVPIHDLGDDGRGHLFYAMKAVKGKPWDEVIEEKSLSENLDILDDVCNAIAFAHDHGVVHRDLKPENVMLGGYGEVLVMDWGLAAAFNDKGKAPRLAAKTGVCGTPAYMSPEMALGEGKKIGPASDVYLLGAILFEILTHKAPHTGATVIKCLENAALNIIRETEVKGELMNVALTAMQTDLDKRYKNVQEFQAAISEYKSHFESINLSKRASEDLEAAEESREYEDFSRAVFGFQEAINLWKKNRDADNGLSKARLAYARCAMEKGDLDLAESQLVEMTADFRELRNKVVALRVERDKRQRMLTIAKYAVSGLLCVVLIGGSFAGYNIYRSREEARKSAEDAKQQATEADFARAKAEDEKLIAERAKKEALKAKADAIKAENVAKDEAKKARAAEQNARIEAERAKQALAQAEREKMLKRQAQAREAKLKEMRWLLPEKEAREKQVAKAAEHNLPIKRIIKLPGNDIKIEFALIPEGQFTMGSPPDEKFRDTAESLHDVRISHPFYMAVCELTREQWRAVTGKRAPTGFPLRSLSPRHPVDSVSFNDAMRILLPAMQKYAPRGFRFDLPTEAEWEYAARACSGGAYFFGNDPAKLSRYAWYFGNSHNHTQGVAQKLPNAWGLYDMHGNIAEWCKDAFVSDYYLRVAGAVLDRVKQEVESLKRKHPDKNIKGIEALLETPPIAVDPLCRIDGKKIPRVVRGGSYMFLARHLRAAHRTSAQPNSRRQFMGLRLVLRKVWEAPAVPAPRKKNAAVPARPQKKPTKTTTPTTKALVPRAPQQPMRPVR